MDADETRRWTQAVAQTIRAERSARNYTQAQVASRAGMPEISYIRYEKGVRPPNIQQIYQICDGLGIPITEFMRRAVERMIAPQ